MWARGCVSRCEFLKSLLLKLMVYPQGGELGNNQCLGNFAAVETPPRMPLWPVQSNEQAERQEGRTSNVMGGESGVTDGQSKQEEPSDLPSVQRVSLMDAGGKL